MALFEREDWSLFRSLGTLPQRAGMSVQLLPRLMAKELVDNVENSVQMPRRGASSFSATVLCVCVVLGQGSGARPDRSPPCFP